MHKNLYVSVSISPKHTVVTYGKYMFKIFRFGFQSRSNHFTFPPAVKEASSCPTCLSALDFLFQIFIMLMDIKLNFIMIFIFTYLKHVEHSNMFINNSYIFLSVMSIQIFLTIYIEIFFFLISRVLFTSRKSFPVCCLPSSSPNLNIHEGNQLILKKNNGLHIKCFR